MALDFEIRKPPAAPKGLALLLHGYDQDAFSIFSKLEKFIPKDFVVFAPTAPFPIPHWDTKLFPAPGWRKQKLRLGYSWYFYQSQTQEYLVDMTTSLACIEAGLENFSLLNLPKIIIGFSQGAYVAPFAALRLSDSKQVICISCEFLPDDLPIGFSFRIDGIFGEKDRIAEIDVARRSHGELVNRGVIGEFRIISGMDHEVNEDCGMAVRELMRNVVKS